MGMVSMWKVIKAADDASLQWTKQAYRNVFGPIRLHDNPAAAIKSLPGSHGVTKEGLESMLQAAHTKAQVLTIMNYLKSEGASNLSMWDRAQMIQGCAHLLKVIATIGGLQ